MESSGLRWDLVYWGFFQVKEIFFGYWAFLVWPIIFFSLTVRKTDSWWTVPWILAFWFALFWGLLQWGVNIWGGYLHPLTLILLFLGATILPLLLRERLRPDRSTDPLWTVMVWFVLKIQEMLFRLFGRIGPLLDRWVVPWHRLPRYVGLPVLIGIRERLRRRNLYDVAEFTNVKLGALPPNGEPTPHDLTTRTADGSFNNLEKPQEGRSGSPFGRNMSGKTTAGSPGEPNPRTISLKLMTREKFEPAGSLNLLAAAWIQFMVHDWFRHENKKNPNATPREDQRAADLPQYMIDIPLGQGDSLRPDQDKNFCLRVPSTEAPIATDGNMAPIYKNHSSHWWDASQLYGNEVVQKQLRSERHGKPWLLEDRMLPHGKLWLSKDRIMLPFNTQTNLDLAGFDQNWWLGLNLMHTLFTLEHNAICDRLREEYPWWSDDELFARARLINAGLMAKIQTVDWTPAVLHHPTVITGMRGNWWGILGRQVRRNFGRPLGDEDEVFSGILGSTTNSHDVPYSLTEEFVSVYRMHPLMPDDFCFYSAKDGAKIENPFPLAEGQRKDEFRLHQVTGEYVRPIRERVTMENLFYSFGATHPGAITLGNYPKGLQELETQDGFKLDLAAVDILRDRERGVPRYNDFRKALGLRRVRTFRALTKRFEPHKRKALQKKLQELYDHIDQVDLMVGLFAEKPPKGFGFSDTAFRIFILMASRRLKSDRFFTTDYRPEIYTQIGLDWIENNDMATVLLRHFPALRPFLNGVDSAFKPWPLVEQLREVSSLKNKENKENKFPAHTCEICQKKQVQKI